MDPNIAQNQTQPISEQMRTSHLPITEAEIIGSHSGNTGGRNYTLLTLASLLVLAGIVGITLFLYIQNKTSPKSISQNIKTVDNDEKCINKVYKSLSEALKDPESVCTIDLSFQGISSLPEDITKLTSLSSLYLTGNKFTVFPMVVLKLKNLHRLDINANQITSIPKEITTLPSLEILTITGNNIKSLPPEITSSGISIIK